MTPRAAGFDGLARVYRTLEMLAFGGDLERARFCLLDRLRDCREILLLGEGDGRCLARLAQITPSAHIHCVDTSAAMLARAAARLSGTATQPRVTFEQADVLTKAFEPNRYDAVATCFVIDCFTPEQAASLVERVQPSLRAGALWLFADFVVPAHGFRRWRARAWLALMYLFFRWQTGLVARALPPSEELLRRAGFRRLACRDVQHGLVRSALFVWPRSSVDPPHN